MARRSGRSGGRSAFGRKTSLGRRAPSRRSSTTSPRTPQTSSKVAPPPSKASSVPAKADARANPPANTSANNGGMLKNIAANAASYAAGMTIARGIDRAIYGRRDEGDVDVIEDGNVQMEAMAGEEVVRDEGECGGELRRFRECLEGSGGNAENCQWNFEALMRCQRNMKEDGFAAAGSF